MVTRSDSIGTPPEGALKGFIDILAAAEDGQLVKDISEATADMVRDLNDQMLIGRVAEGSVTITLNLKADRGIIELTGTYKVKTPPEPRGRSVLYIANAGFLATRDPRQSALVVRSVDGQTRPELRAVD